MCIYEWDHTTGYPSPIWTLILAFRQTHSEGIVGLILQQQHEKHTVPKLPSSFLDMLCLSNKIGTVMFDPSQQLSTMQPLTPFPPTQWDGGDNKEKKGKTRGLR